MYICIYVYVYIYRSWTWCMRKPSRLYWCFTAWAGTGLSAQGGS